MLSPGAGRADPARKQQAEPLNSNSKHQHKRKQKEGIKRKMIFKYASLLLAVLPAGAASANDMTSLYFGQGSVASIGSGALAGSTGTISVHNYVEDGIVLLQGTIQVPRSHVSKDAAKNFVVFDYWQDGANGKEERMSAPTSTRTCGRINLNIVIQTDDFDSVISADYGRRALDYGRRALRAEGEPATARNLAWLHKYVHIAHSDGSVLQAPIIKVRLGGAFSC